MSQINIQGVLRNISSRTNVYDPIIEGIVNAIDAIEEKGNLDGKIKVIFERKKQDELFNGKPEIENIIIKDNGIGLNEENLKAFDEFYTDKKIKKGGKGFGRFMFIKYFEEVKIKSNFIDKNNSSKLIEFYFGKQNEIVPKPIEKYIKNSDSKETGTEVHLLKLKKEYHFYKELKTISRIILEKLLVYFITYKHLPKIIFKDKDTNEEIVLNELYQNNNEIKLDYSTNFELSKNSHHENFELKVFKIFYPQNQKSKIILTADGREVTHESLSEFVTEFEEEFYEEKNNKKRNYILKAYVLSDYLNKNVDVERGNFIFNKDSDLFFPFSQHDVYKKAADILKEKYYELIKTRREKKIQKIQEFIQKKPYYRSYKKHLDLDNIKLNPNDEELEMAFHKIKYNEEIKAVSEINQILKDFDKDVDKKIEEVFQKISQAQQSDLAKYVSLRKVYLDIFQKALEINEEGKYEKEKLVHNIIFPTNKDSENVKFKDHNLWILDERLNFVEYLKSDLKFIEGSKDRVDLLIFDKKIIFGNKTNPSNPVILFEFKRPGRDDFIDKEDPYDQILRYIEQIKEGKIKTDKGRTIFVENNTPMYAYIVADFSDKIYKWLRRKQFKQLPNGQRWINWHDEYNLYTEYITWDQLLKDAEERNRIFFHKLGLHT